MPRVYGIDLGTSTLKIYLKGTGLIYDQKNVMAVYDRKKIIATGNEAWEMAGRAPSNIEVIYPVRSGVLAELKNMTTMLNIIFSELSAQYGKMNGQEFLLAMPSYATEVEKKAIVDMLWSTNVKPKVVRVVDRPIADAIGAGIDIKECFGTLLVDIGAETTEISVVSLGGTVACRMLDIGGNNMDDAIISAVRKDYNFLIGRKTAEQIKNTMGSATLPTEEETITKKAFGRDVVSGLPGSITLDSVFVHEAIKEQLGIILETVRNVFEHVPPEVSADICDSGIYITGGVSGIKNIENALAELTNLKIFKCENGSISAALGLGKIAEDRTLDYLAGEYSTLQIMD